VKGIGKAKSGDLHYQALWFLPAGADFFAARTASIVSAHLLGFSDQDVCSVVNAFAAVEIGDPDANCDGVPESVDADGDTLPDGIDNCDAVANLSQSDLDKDGQGDACDPDDDGDGVPETSPPPFGDNCPGIPNPDQLDANFNQIGAACDPEEDGDLDDDGVPDEKDNCPLEYNALLPGYTEQLDSDGDGEGDACDPDMDQDGISNDLDNCNGVDNPDQADADGDQLGDACDACPNDEDSLVSYGYFKDPLTGETTVFPRVPDSDGDGTPDACDNGGIGRARIEVDGLPFRPARGPRPDGRARRVKLTGLPGQSVSIPVPICLEDCAEAPPANQCVSFAFPGLSGDVLATLTDDGGKSAAKVPKLGERRLGRLQPRGGERYYLNFTLSPRFRGEEEFDLVSRPCTVGDGESGHR
jgi:hypothetical protein